MLHSFFRILPLNERLFFSRDLIFSFLYHFLGAAELLVVLVEAVAVAAAEAVVVVGVLQVQFRPRFFSRAFPSLNQVRWPPGLSSYFRRR